MSFVSNFGPRAAPATVAPAVAAARPAGDGANRPPQNWRRRAGTGAISCWKLLKCCGGHLLGVTALFIASQAGHMTVVQCLIKERGDIEAKTDAGATPLTIAAAMGHALFQVLSSRVVSKVDVWICLLVAATTLFWCEVCQRLVKFKSY